MPARDTGRATPSPAHRVRDDSGQITINATALVKEVADSLVWRSFCRLRLTDKVPDATTLIKLTHRLGPEVIEQLNDALMAQLVEKRLIKRHGQRARVDTTVVEANIHHPTDASLLADGVPVLTRLMRRAKEAGIGVRISVRNRLCSVRRRLRRIGQMLRRLHSPAGD